MKTVYLTIASFAFGASLMAESATPAPAPSPFQVTSLWHAVAAGGP